ncbi:MAG TPA: glycosyltransferase family 2 protein [Planctomycetota bacterium]
MPQDSLVRPPARAEEASRSTAPAGLPATARIRAVTVNYRSAELALRCLESLAAERSAVPRLDAVVVDNASGDGSAQRLQRAVEERGWGAWVQVVESPVNGGFGAGNNLALRAALAEPSPPDFYLLVNPDAALYPGSLRALLGFLAGHPRVGLVGPRTEIRSGQPGATAFRFPGILNALDQGLHFGPLTRLLARWQLAPPPRAEAHPTDWLSGGCVLLRREVLEQVGLFDEGYFLYFEEVDLTWRAAAAGWESWYVPEARALHEAGASTGASAGRELERRMPAYWFESRRRFLLKNRGRLACLVADLAFAGGNLLWNLRRALSGAPRQEPPGFWWDFVRFNLLGRKLGPP